MKNKLVVALLVASVLVAPGCASTQNVDTISETGKAGREIAGKGGEIAKSLFEALGAIFGIVEGFGKDVGKVVDAAIPDAAPETPAEETPAEVVK